jgi:hypothetical protein
MNLIKKGTNRFGKLGVASFFLMGIGVIAFLLTPLLYGRWPRFLACRSYLRLAP